MPIHLECGTAGTSGWHENYCIAWSRPFADLQAACLFRLSWSMLKRFLEWGNQDISFDDFIGLTFVTALITMALCLSLLIILDLLNWFCWGALLFCSPELSWPSWSSPSWSGQKRLALWHWACCCWPLLSVRLIYQRVWGTVGGFMKRCLFT